MNHKEINQLTKIAVEVYDRRPLFQRPVSGSVGRLASLYQALRLGSIAPVKAGPTADDLRQLADLYEVESEDDFLDAQEQATGKRDLEMALYAGGVRPIENLKRIWKRPTKRKKGDPGLSILGKLIGTATSPISDAITALVRHDTYNPYANSATQHTNSDFMTAKLLGNARDFQGRSAVLGGFARGLRPLVSMQEYGASKHGIDLLRQHVQDLPEEEQRALLKRYGKNLSANTMSTLLPPLYDIVPGLVGRTTGAFSPDPSTEATLLSRLQHKADKKQNRISRKSEMRKSKADRDAEYALLAEAAGA
jgi:hypothetical protein